MSEWLRCPDHPVLPPEACPTPGCPGDTRYGAPGRRHIEGCTYPIPPVDGDVPCVCGAQRVRPYPNDTGDHSTTECPIPPGACPSCGSVAGYAEGPPCLTCHYVIPPGEGQDR